MLPRADVRDKLIGASSLSSLKHGAKLGTSSPRRKAQILSLRPDIICSSIRGNVATRLSKIESGEFDATLLAAAGLDRLGMEDVGHYLDDMLPAASQGAIGIECLSEREDLQGFLIPISDSDTAICVNAERAFLAALSGDCHSPIAAFALPKDGKIWLRGQILSADGQESVFAEVMANRDDAAQAGHNLAKAILSNASAELISFFGA